MNVVRQFPAAREYERDPRFRAMFEGAAIGIGICQLDGRILEANPALSRMLGYSQEELAGAHAGELYPELRRGPNPELHRELGRETHPDNFSPDERLLRELMRGERGSFEIEKRYRRKDGSELWGYLTVSLGRDARRQPAFLIAMLADATEHRRVEAHLREAEKMEVIGRLAGGIAHDFNNLLTGILLYCDLLSAGLESAGRESGGFESGGLASGGWEPSELCQHVEEVRMAGEQGAALTHQLLAIARKQAAEPRPIPINEIVASTENLLQRLIGEQIELVIALDPGAGRVLADPAQLRQILLNLVLNARDAMPQGGKIGLSTRVAEFPSEFPGKVSSNAGPGAARRAVSLVVEDNGCGMDAETRARLFEPFFTTKNPGEGTGLGLATVQRIVSESGGTIAVETEPGRGTCIEVFFPALEPAIGETADEERSKHSSNRASPPVVPARAGKVLHEASRKTILLADDHPTARKSMQRVLLHAGYRILPAASGMEALKIFAEHSGAVDLLIADRMMPGMNGQELAETLLRQKPGLKVVLVSGYEDAPVGLAAGAVELVRKPFSGKALIERVVEVLQS
ncbi:MAG: ATP-binding protein [Terriglobales bacterium]|jgi:signal transduction histidine kinase/CheY-like chemotaxis protein